ncbi:MAG: HDIG domain-containing protein [Candidatus Latescibacteria bacterium]|nr:HDIG domain-containing protein [bacterium]MBD3424223.1 HDIG domain-containing protein [Candidatus Latescibacterota bacterium]
MMSREEALELVEEHLSNRNLIKHVLAVEAIMRALARKFDGDEKAWGMAGLLHDLDYERTGDTPEKHGYITVEILEDSDLSEEIKHAILAHAGHVERNSLMDKAIYCSDPVTGLIVASALMHPTKSLSGMDTDFVQRRFKEKRFAAGADRDAISSCGDLGMELQDFIELSLNAMNGISRQLGL